MSHYARSAPVVREPTEPMWKKAFKGIGEWAAILGAAVIAAVVIKTFLIQAFFIPSGSMEKTLMIGDRVLVNKMSYRLHPIRRGDVVVFDRPPGEEGDGTIKELIKRVIGIPGDTVEAKDNQVYVNNRPISEPYLQPGMITDNLPFTSVPPGMLFVMGDNRTNSKDSRIFGPIPESLVVGRAFVLIWPPNDFSLL